MRNAIADHYRQQQRENGQLSRLWTEMRASGDDRVSPPPDWEAEVCACFRALLPTLKPRYSEVLRRIDLRDQEKHQVARELSITVATLDVVLHRARTALRERLEVFCGACSRDQCLACACRVRERRRAQKV